MNIKYLGHASFLIKTKSARVVCDPYSPSIGLKFPKIEADIVTLSHDHSDHNDTSAVTGDPLLINWPGEFEKQGVRVFGFTTYHDDKQGAERGENTVYKFEAEDIAVLHLGDLGAEIESETLDKIGNVDILLVPTGGFYTIDPEQAARVVKQVEPSIVIPMHYRTEAHNVEHFGKLSTVDEFLKKMGADGVEPVDDLTIKKEDIEDGIRVVVMNPANK